MGSLILAIFLGVAALLGSRTLGQAQMGPIMDQPLAQLSGDDFDKAFLAQMVMHHAMALGMAQPVVAQGAHQETKDLGTAIIQSQSSEIAQILGWAKAWYGVDLPNPLTMMPGMPSAQPSMDHSGHMMPGMSGGMPGMSIGMPVPPVDATGSMGSMPMGAMAEMSMTADLWKLSPQRLEATFLSLMIPHHQGA